jgi:enterochelin esterase-like enzyme
MTNSHFPNRGLPTPVSYTTEAYSVISEYLGRQVEITVYLPRPLEKRARYPLLLLNDGQDLKAVGLQAHLEHLTNTNDIEPLIAVGIHIGTRRIREYGTAHRADYKGRGDLAADHTAFVTNELLPWLNDAYPIDKDAARVAFAGFSLGGLSAFDIAWANPDIFGQIGVFSGSFWWRHHDVFDDRPDDGRIVHDMLATDTMRRGMRFWFQTGTLDETEDRNNNGVIDSIDDTLDVISALKNLGYAESDIRYLEIEGGYHDTKTWQSAMSDFLQWAFKKS